MPNLAPIFAATPLLQGVYKEHAHDATSQHTSHDENNLTPWHMGTKVDKLTINLRYGGVDGYDLFGHFYNHAGCLTAMDKHEMGALSAISYEKAYLNKNPNKTHEAVISIRHSSGKQVCGIMLDPVKPWLPPATLHLNPGLIRQLGVESDFIALWQLLFPAGIGAEGLYPDVRKVELAHDFLTYAGGWAYYAISRQSKQKFKNTDYLGKGKSKVSTALYNKGLEQLASKYGPAGDATGVYRLEVRLQKMGWGGDFAASLNKMKNPLNAVHIKDKEALVQAFPPHTNPGFWNAVAQNDLNTALKDMPPKARQKLLAKLKALPQPDWYQPDALWEEMKQAALACPYLQLNSQNQNV